MLKYRKHCFGHGLWETGSSQAFSPQGFTGENWCLMRFQKPQVFFLESQLREFLLMKTWSGPLPLPQGSCGPEPFLRPYGLVYLLDPALPPLKLFFQKGRVAEWLGGISRSPGQPWTHLWDRKKGLPVKAVEARESWGTSTRPPWHDERWKG